MDTMLHKLEKYADNLENIVQQRTAELIDEKQKTDMLLHRMLPTCAFCIVRSCKFFWQWQCNEVHSIVQCRL